MKLQSEFREFDKAIKLSETKKEKILESREAVRKKIREYFKNTLGVNQPKFRIQGSFTLNTALTPINDNEVDIDDGLYLMHISTDDRLQWPAPRKIHKDIMEALKNHTQNGCEDKTSCVRVIYKNDYHIDIPVYILTSDNHAWLGNKKTNEWELSDSKDFKDWFFKNRNDDQTTRLVRYLKAWRDYNGYDFSSIELTILVVLHHVQAEGDFLSLKDTVETIYQNLYWNPSVKKPVSPWEDLWGEKTAEQKQQLVDLFKSLSKDLNSAYASMSEHRASLILREIFGDRFPIVEDNSSVSINNWRSKPWRV